MTKKFTTTKTASTRASQQPQQAQKERQEQVTETQSLTLVKNLIRVSISTICSLRGIFPQGCFQERTYAGMKIYQLDAATRDADTNETIIKDQEAYDLTKWLESGVFEAVELRYLRRMEFIITSPEHENPREAYSFDLTYPEDPRDETITFGGTKLWYFEDRTPAGWQPKHFREADPSELKFSKGRDDKEIDSKLKIKIGDLTTPHHTLSLRFTGYDHQEQQPEPRASDEAEDDEATAGASSDCGIAEDEDLQDDSDGAGSPDSRWSRQEESPSLVKCKFGASEDDDDVDDDDDDEETEVPAAITNRDASRMVSRMMTQLNVAAKGDTHDHPRTDNHEGRQVRIDDAYDAAKAWAVSLARPTIAGLMEHLDLPKELARQCLDRMVDEGLFVKRNFRFHRLADAPRGCPSSRVLPSRGGTREKGEEAYSGRGDMDTDGAADREAGVPTGGTGGPRGDTARGDSFSSQSSSASDDSETQGPSPHQKPTTGDRAHSSCDQQRDHTPSSMPPPPAAPGGRRVGGGAAARAEARTPEGPGGGGTGGGGRDFATPPVPKPSSPPGLKPVPEKPQRNPIVTMAPKRVLDGSALSGHDRGNNNDELEHPHENGRLQEEEPIDVFNPEEDGMGSETGYERLALSQASAASAPLDRRDLMNRKPEVAKAALAWDGVTNAVVLLEELRVGHVWREA
eukprot:g7393.t1